MKVNLRTLWGASLEMEVSPEDTVHVVKLKMESREKISPNDVSLVHRGKELADDSPLSDYDIANGDTISVVFRLRGMISTFTNNDRADPLIQYLMLSDDERNAADAPAPPMEALRRKQEAGSDTTTESSVFYTYHYREDCGILSPPQRQLLCDFLDYAWDNTSSGGPEERVDMRLALNDAMFLLLLAPLDEDLAPDSPFRAEAVLQRLNEEFRKVPDHSRQSKIALRMTRGPTNACINFHFDGGYAKSTCQIALNEPYEYKGGRLCFFVNDMLRVLERPAGSIVSHPPHVLHGVTCLTEGTRKSLFVVDFSNGLGEGGVIQAGRPLVDGFAASKQSSGR